MVARVARLDKLSIRAHNWCRIYLWSGNISVSTANGKNKVSVLFVCLGNICRSPMAEAVFRDLVEKEGLSGRFEITSAGIGDWHAGEPPHRGTRETLQLHGIRPDGLTAKRVSQTLLDRADYVVTMDDENLADLRSWRIDRGKVARLLDYAPAAEVREVPDPYYDGRFELVYQLVSQGSAGLLQQIREQHGF
jgi:protein-tyrosine phosphatase